MSFAVFFGFLGLIYVLFLAGSTGLRVLSRMTGESMESDPYIFGVLAVAFGIVLQILFMTLLGFLSLFHGPWFAAFPAMAIAFGGSRIRADFQRFFKRMRQGAFLEEWSVPMRIAFLGAIALAAILVLAAIPPPSQWDEVAYTLYFPKEFLRQNGFPYLENYGPFAAFPAYGEVMTLSGMRYGSRFLLPHFLNVLAWIMTAFSGTLVADRFGLPTRDRVFAFLLFFAIPAGLEIAPACKNDLLMGFCLLLSLYCLFESTPGRRKTADILGGIFAGVALGTKYTAIQPVAFLGIVAVYRSFSLWKDDWATRTRSLMRFGLPALTIFAPWLIRNAVLLRDPLYPFFADRLGAGFNYPFGEFYARTFFELNFYLKDHTRLGSDSWRPFFAFIGREVGFFPFITVIFCLWNFSSRRFEPRSAAEKSAWLYLAFAFPAMAFLSSWIPRYSIALYVLLGALLFREAERLIRSKKALRLVVLSVVAFQAAFGFAYAARRYRHLAMDAFRKFDERSFVSDRVAFGRVALDLNDTLPENARIATNIQPFYYLRRDFILIHPFNEYGNLALATNLDEFLGKLRELEVTHIAYLPSGDEDVFFRPGTALTVRKADATIRDFIENAEKDGRIRKKNEIEGVRIYELGKR